MTYAIDAQLKAWLDAGLAAHRDGELDRALDAYRQVLTVAPQHPAALNLLGAALIQMGQPAGAVTYLERAARVTRNDPHVHGNLAQAYLALARYDEAREAFRKAARLSPKEPQFQVGVAAALALDGKLGEAETLLDRLSTRFPQAPLVWLNRAHLLRDTRRFDEAAAAYREALRLQPTLIDARVSLGSVLHTTERFAEAETEYLACIAAAPDYLVARYNLASLYMACGRYADAERVCRELLAQAPDHPEAHRLMGTALAHGRRLTDALEHYRRAAELAPNDPAAARSYGGSLMEAGYSAAGLRWLGRAHALEPDSVYLHRIRTGALLAHGFLQDGWIEHVHRAGAAELREARRAWNCTEPLAALQPGKHVCVIGEQGLGDELFFMRYVPRLAAHGCRVSVRCSPRLAPLLRRVEAFPEVLTSDTDVPAADLRILCGDLPLALGDRPRSAITPPSLAQRVTVREYPQRIAVYWPTPAPTLRIAAVPERLAELRERLSALGPAPYFGITWRGGIAPEDQQGGEAVLYKSIDPEKLTAALRAIPGTVIAIQRNPRPGELERASAALGRAAHDLTSLNDDLDAMLALLDLIDEYVGVSNTNMHLRAASGRTARVLVPAPAEWRWMQSGRSSPWFPGFSVYRQSLQGRWDTAMAELRADLELNYGVLADSKSASS